MNALSHAEPPSPDPSLAAVPELPRAIGRYRPLAVLGVGGMGTVYRAHDPLIERQVAIKVIRTDALDGEARAEYLERFRLEAQAAGRCSHPAIVAVYDVLGEADSPAIVMEYVEGQSLAQAFRAGHAVRVALPIAAVLGQVLEGLASAHRLGITHRDIKPANILLTAAGQAKIADFGIARLADLAAGQAMTQLGAMLGTPSYMAPEQVSGTAVDHRADLFAVGAVLYEALTGRPPFAGRSALETIHRLAAPEPASMVAVEAVGAGVFVPVLQRALAKDRARRFESAEAFAAALAAAQASPPPPARPFADDPEATRVAAPLLRTAPPAPLTGGITAGAPTGRWDPRVLARVERALAQYVGPMAKVVVAQAAREAGSTEQLYQALARSLQTAADRSAFLRALGGSRVEPTLARGRGEPGAQPFPGATGTQGPGMTRPGMTGVTGSGAGPIPAEALTAAQAALAQFMGPMARVLARHAAAAATSPADFFERLCAHLTKPEETAALRRRLRAEVEPKLRGP